MQNPTIEAAEAYIIEGIKNQNLGKVPLDPNVLFQGPLHEEPIYGVQALSDYLSGFYPIIKDCRIKKHVAGGDEVCTMWDLELTKARGHHPDPRILPDLTRPTGRDPTPSLFYIR